MFTEPAPRYAASASKVVAEEQISPSVLAGGGTVLVGADQLHQRLRLAIRQRPQQYGVDHAEDRRVGADSEGERDERRTGEARRSAKRSQPIAQILKEHVPVLPRRPLDGRREAVV
jgi:hypothetical protein